MGNASKQWPNEVDQLSTHLHTKLSITNKDWHKLKSDPERRAAELFSGALVQLICGGNSSEAESMIQQGLLWLKREIKDPGCSSH